MCVIGVMILAGCWVPSFAPASAGETGRFMFGVYVNKHAGLISGLRRPIETPDGQPLWRYDVHLNGGDVELIERDLGFELNWPTIGEVGSWFPAGMVAADWIETADDGSRAVAERWRVVRPTRTPPERDDSGFLPFTFYVGVQRARDSSGERDRVD